MGGNRGKVRWFPAGEGENRIRAVIALPRTGNWPFQRDRISLYAGSAERPLRFLACLATMWEMSGSKRSLSSGPGARNWTCSARGFSTSLTTPMSEGVHNWTTRAVARFVLWARRRTITSEELEAVP